VNTSLATSTVSSISAVSHQSFYCHLGGSPFLLFSLENEAVLTPVFSWIRSHSWAGIPDVNEKSLPLLTAWLDRIENRPGTDRALGVPERMKKNLTPEEQEEKAKEAAKWIMNEKN
jgi:hypothetical protein